MSTPDRSPQRIFVTGATGYIGRALCARLRRDGHTVRALVRPTSTVEPLAALGVETFVGDVCDRLSMRQAMSGADWVLHLAADLDFAGPAERMQRVNVAGSENVASLAYKLGVGRMLAVSSIAAYGGSPDDGSLADEAAERRQPPSLYSATKRAGEQAVRAWADRGLRLNVVYPSLVYGPPGKRDGANALLRQLIKERLPVRLGTDRLLSWVYLDDVVEAMVRLMERAEPGRDYLLAGEVMALGELVERVCELAGCRPPRLALPLPLARVAAALVAPLYRVRGRRPPFVRDQLDSLARHWAFDDRRARRELDWQPRGLGEGLPETVAYLS